ncbi:hypothetical protein [Bifidobacterium cuniculi]|uniref:Thiamine biosynthesis protein ThiS n=1 Tax=Bifidobacterium cuniculi TaxID=1688 RepID=A0A087AFH0_9BIFI|nr:hypothetical protein [Bifidobacterium cuniculi]KFI57520.1 thiamine biosynthesis protein ThiS [Bifidobacterium cuniculi]
MAFLFDDEPKEEKPSYLYDNEPFEKPQTILYGDKVIVVPRTIHRTAHGVEYKGDEAFWCWCSIEGREQQAGMFSISGSEDKSPQTSGGLREVTVKQILAPEWHADIHAVVWYDGDMYDVDGAAEHREHGITHHWDVKLRRIADWSQIPEALRPRAPVPAEDAPVWGETPGVSGWHELS